MKTNNDGKTYILTDISYREMILIACGLDSLYRKKIISPFIEGNYRQEACDMLEVIDKDTINEGASDKVKLPKEEKE